MFLQKGTFGIFPASMMVGLKANEQIVLTWLWFHKNQEGVCWPSIKCLARECGCSRDTVIRCIKNLEKCGFIVKTKRRKDGDLANMSNLYDLQITPPPSSRVRLPLVAGSNYPSSRKRQEPYSENHNHLNQKGDTLKIDIGTESIKEYMGRKKMMDAFNKNKVKASSAGKVLL